MTIPVSDANSSCREVHRRIAVEMNRIRNTPENAAICIFFSPDRSSWSLRQSAKSTGAIFKAPAITMVIMTVKICCSVICSSNILYSVAMSAIIQTTMMPFFT